MLNLIGNNNKAMNEEQERKARELLGEQFTGEFQRGLFYYEDEILPAMHEYAEWYVKSVLSDDVIIEVAKKYDGNRNLPEIIAARSMRLLRSRILDAIK